MVNNPKYFADTMMEVLVFCGNRKLVIIEVNIIDVYDIKMPNVIEIPERQTYMVQWRQP